MNVEDAISRLEGIRTVREHYGNVPIMIHAQAYAVGFYEKVGFRISSEQFLEDGIPHYEMIRPADSTAPNPGNLFA